MTDIFETKDVRELLKNKTVVFLGDSNTRGLYKDLVWLLNSNSLIPQKILADKGEKSFPNLRLPGLTEDIKAIFAKNQDSLHYSGSSDDDEDYRGPQSGRQYREYRYYYSKQNETSVHFRFLPTVWDKELENWIADFPFRSGLNIDIMLVSSSIWDMKKNGPLAEHFYRENLENLVAIIPSDCSLFWLTSPPVSANLSSSRGMAVSGLEFQNHTTMFNVVEANKAATDVMDNKDMNIIDLHFCMLSLCSRRNPDGIHWSKEINRLMTNKILTHICLHLLDASSLPGRCRSAALDILINIARDKSNNTNKLKRIPFKLKLNPKINEQVDKKTDQLRQEINEKSSSDNYNTGSFPTRTSSQQQECHRHGTYSKVNDTVVKNDFKNVTNSSPKKCAQGEERKMISNNKRKQRLVSPPVQEEQCHGRRNQMFQKIKKQQNLISKPQHWQQQNAMMQRQNPMVQHQNPMMQQLSQQQNISQHSINRNQQYRSHICHFENTPHNQLLTAENAPQRFQNTSRSESGPAFVIGAKKPKNR